MKLRLPHKLQAALIATLASAALTTLSTGSLASGAITADNAAGWAVFDSGNWVYSDSFDGSITTTAQSNIQFRDAAGNLITFGGTVGSTTRSAYTFAVELDLDKLVTPTSTGTMVWGGDKVGFGLDGNRKVTAAIGTGNPAWSTTNTALPASGTITIVVSTGNDGSYIYGYNESGTQIFTTNNWPKLKEGSPSTYFHIAQAISPAVTKFAAWQADGIATASTADLLSAYNAMSQFPIHTPAVGTDIGNWMAIGDSISHGTNEYSYRWGLQKIFTDNGISFDAIGVQKTGFYAGYDTASYGGTAFDNEHCAQFNVKTEEIAGTATTTEQWYGQDYNGRPTSLWYSNVENWLDLSDQLTANQGTYPHSNMGARGTTFTGENAPDTYTIMLGSNDLSTGRSNEAILGDVAVILDAAQERAAIDGNATVYLMSVPHTGSKVTAEKVDSYNTALQAWIAQNKGNYANLDIHYANINSGLYDVTGKTYGAAPGMLQDWAHPTAQGNLIIAGNLAREMGYAGRTAGQFRKAAVDFAQHEYAGGFSELPSTGLTNVTLSGTALDFSAAGDSSVSFNWDNTPAGGYTVDFSLQLGNGSTGGWDTTTNFSMSLGNGTLNVNEAYIQWGNTVLYSRDASSAANLRVAYVQEDAANNLAAGYYVWLGDQLIGEACAASGSLANAVTFSYSGSGRALLGSLAMDSTRSWAPTSVFTEGDAGYHANPFDGDFRIGTRQGEGDFTHANEGATQQALTDGIISGKRKSGDYYYANYSGDSGNLGNCHVWSFEKANAGGSNLHYVTYGLGNGSADVTARLAGANMNFNTVHGLYNGSAATMSADVLTQLDSVGGTFGTYHGSEKMSSTGRVALTMNEGTISGDVVGGFALVANDSQSIEATEIVINHHAVVGGDVYGGSTANGAVSNARVAITGGSIGGSVYGGGTAGSVGSASVEITGGSIQGSVYGGGKDSGTVDSSSVTIKTYVPYIKGDIQAHNVTISDLHIGPATDEHGFDKYAGTITADTITLENTTTFSTTAHLVTKTLNVRNKSSVTIHDLTLTACEINMDATSVATLDGTLTLGNVATYTGTLNLADGLTIDVSALDFGDKTQDVALLTTTSGNLGTTNVNNIILDFGETPAPSSYNLARNGENLVLTFAETPVLIWDHTQSTNWNTTDNNWHLKDQAAGSSTFTAGADVRFDAAGSNGQTVTLGGAISAGNMTIDKDVAVTINAGNNNLTAVLKGEGTYVLPAGQKTLPAGVTLDSAEWTGAVQMSGTGLTELRFVTKAASSSYGLATDKSVIELKGVAGWMRTEAQLRDNDHIGTEHNADIRLVNVDSTPALKITDGGSNSTTTLSGKITGSGTFEHNWGGGSCTFKLTGDLSGWNGEFNKSGGGTTTLALTDNASTIAPNIKNSGSGTLNLNINNGNAVAVTGDITKSNGTLNLNIGNEKATDATFSGNVSISSLTVGKKSAHGANATFNGTLDVSGNATLIGTAASNAVVAFNGDTTINGNFDFSSGQTAKGTATVATNKTLDIKGRIWMNQGTTLSLQKDATVKLGSALTLKGLAEDGGSIVREGSTDEYNLNNSSYTLDKVQATFNTANSDVQLKFTNSEIVSGQDVTLKNAANSLTSTTVTGNTLTVDAAMGLGNVSVTGGTLALASGSPVTIGSGSIAAGATFKLGAAEQFIVNAGSFGFASGANLDLTALNITTRDSVTLGTASGGSFSTDNLGSVAINLGHGAPAGAYLDVQDGNLVLTFTQPKDLIWDNAADNGLWDSGDNWHAAATPTAHVAFSEGDNVQFSSGFANTVALNGDVNAGTMTIDSGVAVTVNTAGHNLSVYDLDSTGGALTKNGAGTATFGGSDTAGITLAALSVTGGSVEFDELVTVTGGTSITPTNSSSVTFHNGLAFTGQGGTYGYALIINNGITGTLGGTTSMSTKLIGVAAGGSLVLENNASVTVKGVYNTTRAVTSNGTIQIGDNATLTTSGGSVYSTGVTMGSGSTLTLGGNSEVSKVTGSGTVNVNGGNLTIGSNGNTIGALNIASGKTVNLNGGGTGTTIATIGSLSGAGNISISSANANRHYYLTGDISGWTGTLTQASGSGNMYLDITGTDALKGNIVNIAANTGSGFTLALNLLHSMVVDGNISYTSKSPTNVAVGDTSHAVEVSFNGTVMAGDLTVAANSSASFTQTSTVTKVNGTGSIAVSSGTLTVGGTDGNFRSVTVADGATLALNGNANNDFRLRYTLAGGTITNTGSDTGSGKVQNDQITLTADSTITGSANFYMLGNNYGKTELHLGTHTLEKTGTNEVILWSTEVSSGDTSGTLKITEGSLNIDRYSSAKPMSSVDANIVLNVDGADSLKGNFDLAANHSISSTAADARMSANVALQGATTLSAAEGYSLAVSGILSGSGAVTKTGTGTVTFSGANTYSGATEVREGTLEVSTTGSLGTGSVSVAENANLKFAPTSADTTVAIALSGAGTLEHSGTGTTTYTGSTAAFHGNVDVEEGVLNIMNAASVNVKDVTIGAGATMGVYKNGTAAEANEGKVTIAYGYTLSAGNLARLNADLEMQHGSLLDVSKAQVGTTDINGLIMGSSVTIQGAVYEDGKLTSPGTYLVYTDDAGHQHNALEEVDGYLRDYFATSGNQYYVLFNDVEELFLNGSTEASGEIAFNGWDQPFTDANTLFSNVNQNTYAVVYSFNGTNVGTLAICLVPEPTTGTLSLLALCALAARRRRRS